MKVRFWYIKAYDNIFEEMYRLKQYEAQQSWLPWFKNPYYTEEKIKQYMDNLKQWREVREEKIINTIEEIFGSPFKKKYIVCHCVWYYHKFAWLSHPLTVCVWSNKDIDKIGLVLLHELIHIKQNEWEENEYFEKYTHYLREKEKINDYSTISHILLYTAMYYICNKVWLGDIYKTESNVNKWTPHHVAWDYIHKHWYENIWKSYQDLKNKL